MDQPGKVANPACVRLNKKNEHFPVPVFALRIGSHEAGSAVQSRVRLLILHTTVESGAYSRDSSRFPRRRPFMYTVKPPLGQSRVGIFTAESPPAQD